ncbi:TRAP transporter small permease [Marinobacter sp.]|uniref:TRAP transporter small permease n=1 Tax=Marinobacter sp. TaxID=50741 RepID=UPI000C67F36D|nr:TRAP transporter small permease [Marinobacter sp.]MBE97390.1 C4-dicarboxylate ABC transporter permease [Marinobacter sp.]|tara:strand:- start:30637 stop:31236 length:600 start_codon:yes stop_codon:yes gene_type:complete
MVVTERTVQLPNHDQSGVSHRAIGHARGALAWLENAFLLLGVVCILGLCSIITASVLLRTFSTSGIPDEVVIVGELMIGALILPLAFVAAHRGFISVEIFTQRLGPKFQQALNVLTAVVGLVAVAPITYAGYLSMVDAFESGAYFFGLMELPKWPGHTLFFLGYFLFFIRLIDLAVYDSLEAFGVIKTQRVETNDEVHD